jgi:hypothetical protein
MTSSHVLQPAILTTFVPPPVEITRITSWPGGKAAINEPSILDWFLIWRRPEWGWSGGDMGNLADGGVGWPAKVWGCGYRWRALNSALGRGELGRDDGLERSGTADWTSY